MKPLDHAHKAVDAFLVQLGLPLPRLPSLCQGPSPIEACSLAPARVLLAVVLVMSASVAPGFAAAGSGLVSERDYLFMFPEPAQAAPPQALAVNVASVKQWNAGSGNRAYSAQVLELQKVGVGDDDLLDMIRNGAVSGMKGTITGERYITSFGLPGREIEVDVAKGLRSIQRLFFDPDTRRLFQLVAVVAKAEAGDPKVATFLNSFVLNRTVGTTMYKSPDGGFSALLPGTPEESTNTVEQGTLFIAMSRQDGRAFAVMRFQTKAALNGDPQARLDGARDGGMKGKKIISETRVTVLGRPGRDIRFEEGRDVGFSRIVLDAASRRVYTLVVASRKERADEKVAAAFLQSLGMYNTAASK